MKKRVKVARHSGVQEDAPVVPRAKLNLRNLPDPKPEIVAATDSRTAEDGLTTVRVTELRGPEMRAALSSAGMDILALRFAGLQSIVNNATNSTIQASNAITMPEIDWAATNGISASNIRNDNVADVLTADGASFTSNGMTFRGLSSGSRDRDQQLRTLANRPRQPESTLSTIDVDITGTIRVPVETHVDAFGLRADPVASTFRSREVPQFRITVAGSGNVEELLRSAADYESRSVKREVLDHVQRVWGEPHLAISVKAVTVDLSTMYICTRRDAMGMWDMAIVQVREGISIRRSQRGVVYNEVHRVLGRMMCQAFSLDLGI